MENLPRKCVSTEKVGLHQSCRQSCSDQYSDLFSSNSFPSICSWVTCPKCRHCKPTTFPNSCLSSTRFAWVTYLPFGKSWMSIENGIVVEVFGCSYLREARFSSGAVYSAGRTFRLSFILLSAETADYDCTMRRTPMHQKIAAPLGSSTPRLLSAFRTLENWKMVRSPRWTLSAHWPV
jgi:hypothetical protein